MSDSSWNGSSTSYNIIWLAMLGVVAMLLFLYALTQSTPPSPAQQTPTPTPLPAPAQQAPQPAPAQPAPQPAPAPTPAPTQQAPAPAPTSPAPVDGYFSPWTDWSDCDKPCGGGISQRTRSYTPPEHGGNDLPLADRLNTLESQVCNQSPCPVNGHHTSWSEWSDCRGACGSGVRERSRSYIPAAHGGVELSLADQLDILENEICSLAPCPVDGYHTPWTEWTPCSGDKTCGDGVTERFREYVPAMHGGKDLSLSKQFDVIERVKCSLAPCPVDGYHTPWTEWTQCSKACGGGVSLRSRTYSPAMHGGKDAPDDEQKNLLETVACNTQVCRVDGYHTPWTEWTPCSKICGGGVKRRYRTYVPATGGGFDLNQSMRSYVQEDLSCNTQACPPDGIIVPIGSSVDTSKPFTVLSPNSQFKFVWYVDTGFDIYQMVGTNWSNIRNLRSTTKFTTMNMSGGQLLMNGFARSKPLSEMAYTMITDTGKFVVTDGYQTVTVNMAGAAGSTFI